MHIRGGVTNCCLITPSTIKAPCGLDKAMSVPAEMTDTSQKVILFYRMLIQVEYYQDCTLVRLRQQ